MIRCKQGSTRFIIHYSYGRHFDFKPILKIAPKLWELYKTYQWGTLLNTSRNLAKISFVNFKTSGDKSNPIEIQEIWDVYKLLGHNFIVFI